MSNLEQFNEISAVIFPKLYESFPSKIDIRISDFPKNDTEENSQIFFDTLNFYSDEKFITFEQKVYGAYKGVRLTSKGFSVLNADAPVRLYRDSSFIDAIKNVAEIGKSELIKEIISTAVKYGIRTIS